MDDYMKSEKKNKEKIKSDPIYVTNVYIYIYIVQHLNFTPIFGEMPTNYYQ